MRPGGWTSRTIARQVIVLPEPDSPTSANVSPGCTWKLTPRTACTDAAPRGYLDPQILDGQQGLVHRASAADLRRATGTLGLGDARTGRPARNGSGLWPATPFGWATLLTGP